MPAIEQTNDEKQANNALRITDELLGHLPSRSKTFPSNDSPTQKPSHSFPGSLFSAPLGGREERPWERGWNPAMFKATMTSQAESQFHLDCAAILETFSWSHRLSSYIVLRTQKKNHCISFVLNVLFKEARKGFWLHASKQSTPRCTRQLNESKEAHRKLNAA